MDFFEEKNPSDLYDDKVFNTIVKLAPFIGCCAAVTFTVARSFGLFPGTSIIALIGFDSMFLLYCLVSYVIKRIGVQKNGELNFRMLDWMQVVLVSLVIVQWNLISYIFPTRDFWGYAPLFILLTGFFFSKWAVRTCSVGILASIGVSWLIMGDSLLPLRDASYAENLVMRFVSLVVSTVVINSLIGYASNFKEYTRSRTDQLWKKSKDFQELSQEIIEFTANLIEQRDETSGTHVKRVQQYVKILSQCVMENYPEYGLDPDKVELISLASSLHDIGKIKISDSVLLKPGRLTADEFELIKRHTVFGASMTDMLPDRIESSFRKYSREICMYHHERYDGRGYPVGLQGDDIPISAQIVAVVDCYDALTSKRPYKEPFPPEKAAQMIVGGECGTFSPKMLKCFEICFKDPAWMAIH